MSNPETDQRIASLIIRLAPLQAYISWTFNMNHWQIRDSLMITIMVDQKDKANRLYRF